MRPPDSSTMRPTAFKPRCPPGMCAGLAIPPHPSRSSRGRASAQTLAAQEISSHKTSRPQTPAGFKIIDKVFGWKPGTLNFDLGGGAYDISSEYLKERGVENLVYDRFSRSGTHNDAVLKIANKKGFDTTTLMNVLNVIKESAARASVLSYLAELAAESRGKVAFISVYYEPTRRSGVTKTDKLGRPEQWQEQRPLASYLKEISAHFRLLTVVGGKEGVVVASNDPYAFHDLLDSAAGAAKRGRVQRQVESAKRGRVQRQVESSKSVKPVVAKPAKRGRAEGGTAFDFERYKRDVNALRIGKRLPEDTYLHKSATGALSPELQELIAHAESIAGLERRQWDLVKLSRVQPKISFLVYPTFFDDAFPAIDKSFTVDIKAGSVRAAVYKNNPQILHRKETFLLPTHPRYSEFKKMTEHAVVLGLFDEDLKKIGRVDYWGDVLKRRGVRVIGNEFLAGRER